MFITVLCGCKHFLPNLSVFLLYFRGIRRTFQDKGSPCLLFVSLPSWFTVFFPNKSVSYVVPSLHWFLPRFKLLQIWYISGKQKTTCLEKFWRVKQETDQLLLGSKNVSWRIWVFLILGLYPIWSLFERTNIGPSNPKTRGDLAGENWKQGGTVEGSRGRAMDGMQENSHKVGSWFLSGRSAG